MGFTWIINQWYKSGINPLKSNLVEVDSVPQRTDYPLENIFKWDSKTRAILQGNSTHNLTISFQEPVSIYKYKLQINSSVRFLTGWQFEVSYDGSFFTVVDVKDMNFCSENTTNNNDIVDCKYTTTLTFSIPLSNAKSVRIAMTKPDSSGTYRMEFNSVDFYIARENYFLYMTFCDSRITHLYLMYASLISLY